MYYILSVIAGVLVVINMSLNASFGQKTSTFHSNYLNYFSGLFFITLIIFISKKPLNYGVLPAWYYLGGALGVAVIFIFNFVVPKISVVYTSFLSLTGQIFSGIIIDYIISSKFSLGKTLGGLIIFTGLIYNFIIDKKIKEKNLNEIL